MRDAVGIEEQLKNLRAYVEKCERQEKERTMENPSGVSDNQAKAAKDWLLEQCRIPGSYHPYACVQIIDEWSAMKRQKEQDEAAKAGWAAIKKAAGHKTKGVEGEDKKELPSGFGFEGIIPPGSPILKTDERINDLSERIENIAKSIGGVPRYESVCELVARVERLETLPGRLKDDVESLSASIAVLEDDGNAAELARRVSQLEKESGNAAQAITDEQGLRRKDVIAIRQALAQHTDATAELTKRVYALEQERAADKKELENIRTWFSDIMETCKKLALDYKDVSKAARVVRGLAELGENYPPKTCSACRGNKGWWDETGTKWCGCETCGATGMV